MAGQESDKRTKKVLGQWDSGTVAAKFNKFNDLACPKRFGTLGTLRTRGTLGTLGTLQVKGELDPAARL